MIEAGQHSSLDQEPESSPLNLDASPVEQFRALSQWHLDYARDNPKTFRELNSLLASLGIKNETFQINGRIFKLAQESFTKPQRLRFLDQLAQLAYLPENSPYGATLTLSKPLKTKPTLEETWVAGLEKQKASMLRHGTLAELFSHSINQIKIERDREILQRRLGLSPYEVHTLQEVADVVGVTRERVRQIVKKQLVKLEKDHLWDDVFREEVKRMFDSFGPLLPVNKLSSLSQWFDGFELSSKSWDVFLGFFSPDVALLNNSTAAWLIPATNLVVLTEIAESLKNLRSEGASNIEIEDALSERLSLYTSNTEFFKEQLFDYVPESRVTDASLVRKFLSETTTAFDLDDFYHFCMRNDHTVDKRNRRSILNHFTWNAAPVSRSPTKYISRIGLESLLPDIDEYIDQLLDYWYGNYSEDRVFHGDEIRDWALANDLAFHDPWSSWLAVAPLKLDLKERFENNKLVIALSRCWKDKDLPTRRQLIEELLRKRGSPMRASEIIEAINPVIGVGDHRQIFDEGKIRFIGDNSFEYRGD